jgi:hypothetical protein
LGIEGYQGCHFSAIGYANMANRMLPVVSRDFYGAASGAVTAPNLQRAYFTSSARTAIALEFDQAISWSSLSLFNWYVDDVSGVVSSGSASGNTVTLELSSAAAETANIDYLQDTAWSHTESDSTLLYGANGIPALTFADVLIGVLPSTSFNDWAADPEQGLTAGVNDGPLDDPEFDGIVNLLEFVLFGDPLVPSPEILPAMSASGDGTWIFEYERSNLSEPPATTQVVEYGSDLENWTELAIPLSSDGIVTITPGSESDHVSVAIPDLGTAGFARLKVSE